MPVKLDHVGIVVKDINEAASLYEKMLGLTPWKRGVTEDSEEGVKLLSLPIGDTFVELIQPTNPQNRFAKFLKERGEGLFHLSFLSEDYETEVAGLKKKGYTVEEQVVNAFPGSSFRQIWLRPEDTLGVWIELVEMNALPKYLLDHKF
jgi:methylmalonyl-CoA epimerase